MTERLPTYLSAPPVQVRQRGPGTEYVLPASGNIGVTRALVRVQTRERFGLPAVVSIHFTLDTPRHGAVSR